MRRTQHAFTLLELLIVMSIIAILALMFFPTYIDRTVREEVKEGMKLAEVATTGVALEYRNSGSVPLDNRSAKVPPSDKIVSRLVKDTAVVAGAVVITFGNSAHYVIRDKKLVLRPAIVEGYSQVPVSWLCNTAPVPKGMVVLGFNTTDIDEKYLPLECRNLAPKTEG